jgi:hypothetical protein
MKLMLLDSIESLLDGCIWADRASRNPFKDYE